MNLEQSTRIQTGSFGPVDFPAGRYVYLGSARGPGGLSARIARHFAEEKKLYWHIDYFLRYADLLGFCYTISEEPRECLWSQHLIQKCNGVAIQRGFGNSDCKSNCQAHLIHFPAHLSLKQLQYHINNALRGQNVFRRRIFSRQTEFYPSGRLKRGIRENEVKSK